MRFIETQSLMGKGVGYIDAHLCASAMLVVAHQNMQQSLDCFGSWLCHDGLGELSAAF
ncbi:MAG: hypothetical protein RJB34_557 [Pseudomonadota bacterium]|jgi:hypothetical protein